MKISKWVDNPPIYYNQESGIEIDFLVENRNYEVKYRNNCEEIGLSTYNDLIKNITVIVLQKKKVIIEKYPNIGFIESWDFCS